MNVKLAKGDIAHIDFDLWVVGPGDAKTLRDTTHADTAKAQDLYDEKKPYVPLPVVVGHERVAKGLDEALLELSVGEHREVVIPPEKGAGERDPKLVRLYKIQEFIRKDIDPAPGMEVTMDNRRGTITAVTAGRVRVDFNNPLAGRTLRYDVTVAKRAETPEEKVRGVLEMDYGMSDRFRVFVKDDEVDVFLPDVCRTDDHWYVSKFRVVADLREFVGLSKIRFVEEYERPKEAPKEEKPEAEGPPKEAAKEAAKPAEEPKPPKAGAPAARRGKKAKPEKREPPAEEEIPAAEKAPEEL